MTARILCSIADLSYTAVLSCWCQIQKNANIGSSKAYALIVTRRNTDFVENGCFPGCFFANSLRLGT